MSDQEEPSYYEIALTNRQVLVAFVILLGCMLAAFFAGVWVGKGNGAPPPQVATTSPTQDEDPLRKFSFFEQGDNGSQPAAQGSAPAGQQAPPPAARPQEPPPPANLDDLGGQDLDDDDEPPPVDLDEEPEPEPPPPAQTAPPPPPPATPDGPRGLPRTTARRPPPEPTGKELFIQVFSTQDQEQASRVRRRLNDSGYSAFLSPVEVDNRTMYRVRIGPFVERADAERVAGQVKEGFKLDTWITSSN